MRFFASALIVLGAPFIANAQYDFLDTLPIGTVDTSKQLILDITPNNPGPGDSVRLTLRSSAIDLDRADIIWTINGTASTTHAKEQIVIAPKIGSTLTIEVDAVDIDENRGHAEAVLRPTEVALLWSADSYAPPFFRGRTLPGSNATIRAYALARLTRANASLVPESDIVYTWYRNDTELVALSGRGKSSITIDGPSLFGADTIRVEVSSVDRSLRGAASARIPAVDTILTLYENHPLFGILYHRAIIGTVNTNEREQKITAVPYFAHVSSPESETLSYTWHVNDIDIPPDLDEPQTLTIDASKFRGLATIELSLVNALDIFMRASGVWRIDFGENNSLFTGTGNVFGN